MSIATPKTDVDKRKYAENEKAWIIQLTSVKTIPSVLIVIFITLRVAGNARLNKEKERSRWFEQRKN